MVLHFLQIGDGEGDHRAFAAIRAFAGQHRQIGRGGIGRWRSGHLQYVSLGQATFARGGLHVQTIGHHEDMRGIVGQELRSARRRRALAFGSFLV